jgi:hypothetical protein
MRDSIAKFLSRVIQISYAAFLIGLTWALLAGGLRLCIGKACSDLSPIGSR